MLWLSGDRLPPIGAGRIDPARVAAEEGLRSSFGDSTAVEGCPAMASNRNRGISIVQAWKNQ